MNTAIVSEAVAERHRDMPQDTHRVLLPVAWVLVGISGVLGIIGLVWRFTGGHADADYGSYVPWGLWIAAYVALVGASAGAFALAALIFTLRATEHYRLAVLALVTAFAAFAAGMVNVWLDLGHPFRAWKLLVDTEFGSVMGWMAWFYTLYGVLLLVGLFLTRTGVVPMVMERFAWVAFLFAFVFAGAEGALFGVVGARPLWESGLTPVLFLVEAMLFGIAMVLAAAVVFGITDRSVVRRMSIAILLLLAALLVLEWSEFSTGLAASVPAKEEAIETILFGDFWWVFWILHLGVGVLVPAGMLLFGLRRDDRTMVGVAAGLVLAMSIATKLNLVVPALAQEETDGLAEAYTGPGLVYEYFPSLMEWMVWLGTLSLAGGVVLAGRRLMGDWLADRGPGEHDDGGSTSEVEEIEVFEETI